MSDVIKLLPDSVANQIAAGEVIQRPASVIKELVENAIDAGATSVKIILKDGGRSLIQVIDNGSGMSETDARLAFERHSTSKIKAATDLFNLHTMGFRGEALASIAAISQVELKTRKKGAEMGTRLCITASKCELQEADYCPEGSNFMIKNIFFNVPARRKFLKSKQVELSNIVREFERLALVNTSTEFLLANDDNIIFQLMAGDSLKKRIAALFSRSIEQQLISLETDTSIVKISGFVGKPENARKRNALQYFFVNGRHMRHPYFHKAVMNCYDQLIPDDEQPNYFIFFDVDPASIDVNIHPTKNEIKFENEQAIWQILFAATKEALGKFNAVPSIDFDTDGLFEMPEEQQNSKVFGQPTIEIDPTFNPFNETTPSPFDKGGNTGTGGGTSSGGTGGGSGSGSRMGNLNFHDDALQNWDELYSSFENNRGKSTVTVNSRFGEQAEEESSIFAEKFAEEPTVYNNPRFQINDKYIVLPNGSELLIIDQHRAHVRILFDKMMKTELGEKHRSQRVLFPEVIQLTSPQSIVMEGLQTELENLGFEVSFLGNNSWTVNSLPAILIGMDVKEFFNDIIDSNINGGKSASHRIREAVVLSSAKAAAIKSGRKLDDEEMLTIINDLLNSKESKYTPDGKLIIASISKDEISKLFM